MRTELQASLFTRFPLFLRVPPKRGVLQPFDGRGFEIGDGWFDIAEQLCNAAEMIIHKQRDGGMPEQLWLRLSQVKEKLGLLRVYFTGTVPEELRKFTLDLEKKSSVTCEACGEVGVLRNSDYLHLHTCEDCENTLRSAQISEQ